MVRQDGGNKAAKNSSLTPVANSIMNVCERSCLVQNLEVRCFHLHAKYFACNLAIGPGIEEARAYAA